jgi:hypothetical protein
LGGGCGLFHVASRHIPGVGIGDVGEIIAQEKKNLPLFVHKEDAAALSLHETPQFWAQALSKLLPSSCARIWRRSSGITVFKMLLSEAKITEGLVRMLMSWRHSGFNFFSGPRIYPREETAMENLARYIIRASFSQERISYVEEDGKLSTDQRTARRRRSLTPWNGWQPCVLTSPIRESRWSATMATTVMFPEANGTSRTKTGSYRASSRLMYQRKGVRRTGPG